MEVIQTRSYAMRAEGSYDNGPSMSTDSLPPLQLNQEGEETTKEKEGENVDETEEEIQAKEVDDLFKNNDENDDNTEAGTSSSPAAAAAVVQEEGDEDDDEFSTSILARPSRLSLSKKKKIALVLPLPVLLRLLLIVRTNHHLRRSRLMFLKGQVPPPSLLVQVLPPLVQLLPPLAHEVLPRKRSEKTPT